MHTNYFIFLGLCLIGLAVRVSYELLKKTGKVNQKSNTVIAIVFAAMCLMLSSWCFMCPLDPWHINLPSVVKLTGLVILIIGSGIALGGVIQLRGVENIDHLVTSGLFSRIRHPMYTGFILWILGWVIFYGAATSLIVALVCIGNILYWRQIEEENLLSAYGEAYLRYRMKTWF
jgi:protein-S-isoprenylcysteine O-methyltransferase Ste14